MIHFVPNRRIHDSAMNAMPASISDIVATVASIPSGILDPLKILCVEGKDFSGADLSEANDAIC